MAVAEHQAKKKMKIYIELALYIDVRLSISRKREVFATEYNNVVWKIAYPRVGALHST